ncbi:AraC family ligand binding domain-containing protein [Streptomyces longispororuber]|uniref:AraC family transcriptional regulator n=1 Tax=Streptomyces longispororuber TaxID=68230 RepID=UPI0036FFCEFF
MTGSAERARHWTYAELPGVDLLRARYVRKTFARHTHEHYVMAAVTDGVDVFHHTGADRHAGPGTLALINPDTPHTGRGGGPEGWRYGAVYPAPELVAAIAAETTAIRGTPGFTEPVFADPYAVALVHQVLRAAEDGNALAADTVLRLAVTRLLRRNGGSRPERTVRSAGERVAARARAVLEEHLTAPPTLERLATGLGVSPFALLRAFRDAYGMPPHAWLTDARVRRARHLLDAGTTPAEAAVAVGFTDQPHLNRHFTRIVGVPPGAYQRERKNVQDRPARLLVASSAWQNEHHPRNGHPPRTYAKPPPPPPPPRSRRTGTDGRIPLPPSSATPSASVWRSASPGSPSA